MPELRNAVGALTPKLEQVVHTLEWVRIEEFVRSTGGGCGRPVLKKVAIFLGLITEYAHFQLP